MIALIQMVTNYIKMKEIKPLAKGQMFEAVDLRISKILEHIQNVQRNCYRLGMNLIHEGQIEQGRILIANGQIHDNSKFKGIEFDHLINGSPILPEAIKHHQSSNPHHPEFWGGIQNMPDIYLAEMVCDCAARASEFGTSVKEWFEKQHPKSCGYKADSEVAKKIQYYLNLLLDPKF